MKTALIAILCALFCLTAGPARAGSLPDMARAMASSLDGQLVERLELMESPARGVSLIVTTPVSLDDLEQASPLSRLLAEELATWFIESGYKVQEIRKGESILFAPKNGELLLTRQTRLLDERNIQSALVLAGTYSVTSRHVRFNIRLIHAASNEVLAMASKTLANTPEVRELLGQGQSLEFMAVKPSVHTNFDSYRAQNRWAGGSLRP